MAEEPLDPLAETAIKCFRELLFEGGSGHVARPRYKKQAGQGNADAHFFLAKMLYEGKGGPVDRTEACVQFKKAADQGHSDAQGILAELLKKEEAAQIASEQLLTEENKRKERKERKEEKGGKGEGEDEGKCEEEGD